jgi:hypothetical protein
VDYLQLFILVVQQNLMQLVVEVLALVLHQQRELVMPNGVVVLEVVGLRGQRQQVVEVQSMVAVAVVRVAI